MRKYGSKVTGYPRQQHVVIQTLLLTAAKYNYDMNTFMTWSSQVVQDFNEKNIMNMFSSMQHYEGPLLPVINQLHVSYVSLVQQHKTLLTEQREMKGILQNILIEMRQKQSDTMTTYRSNKRIISHEDGHNGENTDEEVNNESGEMDSSNHPMECDVPSAELSYSLNKPIEVKRKIEFFYIHDADFRDKMTIAKLLSALCKSEFYVSTQRMDDKRRKCDANSIIDYIYPNHINKSGIKELTRSVPAIEDSTADELNEWRQKVNSLKSKLALEITADFQGSKKTFGCTVSAMATTLSRRYKAKSGSSSSSNSSSNNNNNNSSSNSSKTKSNSTNSNSNTNNSGNNNNNNNKSSSNNYGSSSSTGSSNNSSNTNSMSSMIGCVGGIAVLSSDNDGQDNNNSTIVTTNGDAAVGTSMRDTRSSSSGSSSSSSSSNNNGSCISSNSNNNNTNNNGSSSCSNSDSDNNNNDNSTNTGISSSSSSSSSNNNNNNGSSISSNRNNNNTNNSTKNNGRNSSSSNSSSRSSGCSSSISNNNNTTTNNNGSGSTSSSNCISSINSSATTNNNNNNNNNINGSNKKKTSKTIVTNKNSSINSFFDKTTSK